MLTTTADSFFQRVSRVLIWFTCRVQSRRFHVCCLGLFVAVFGFIWLRTQHVHFNACVCIVPPLTLGCTAARFPSKCTGPMCRGQPCYSCNASKPISEMFGYAIPVVFEGLGIYVCLFSPRKKLDYIEKPSNGNNDLSQAHAVMFPWFRTTGGRLIISETTTTPGAWPKLKDYGFSTPAYWLYPPFSPPGMD